MMNLSLILMTIHNAIIVKCLHRDIVIVVMTILANSANVNVKRRQIKMDIAKLVKDTSKPIYDMVPCDWCKKPMKFEGRGSCPECEADPYNRKGRY